MASEAGVLNQGEIGHGPTITTEARFVSFRFIPSSDEHKFLSSTDLKVNPGVKRKQ